MCEGRPVIDRSRAGPPRPLITGADRMKTRVALLAVATSLCLAHQPQVAAWAQGKAAGRGRVERMEFGKMPDGTPVELYVLTNGRVTAKVMTYGAILTELDVPDRSGKPADVVLGFENLEGYLGGHPYFGATVGRVANQVGGAKFRLDGKDYALAVNNGPNSLHGGTKGF